MRLGLISGGSPGRGSGLGTQSGELETHSQYFSKNPNKAKLVWGIKFEIPIKKEKKPVPSTSAEKDEGLLNDQELQNQIINANCAHICQFKCEEILLELQ